MEKYNFNNNQIELLEALSREDYNIIVVTDRLNVFKPDVYIVIDYRWATDRNPYLNFSGWKKITNIIADNSIYTNNLNALRTIITQIDNSIIAVSKQREFSSSQFSWIKF